MEELKKFLNPILFVVIIICFFLPFFNITCQQQKIASLTGFELIIGTKVSFNGLNKGLGGISIPQNEIGEGIKTDYVSPEPLALVVFLLAIGGLIFSFFEKYSIIGSASVGLLGVLSLIFFSFTITDNILGKVHVQALTLECSSGFYIAIILFIIILIYNGYLFSQRIMYKPLDLQVSDSNNRFCPHCQSENDIVSLYCNKCGSRMEENIIL
jgi:hypothetical protein